MSLNKLSIFNPSDYGRVGHVTVPWQPIHEQTEIQPGELILRDNLGTQLSVQIDEIDPKDPNRNTLVFFLDKAIPPGTAYVSVDKGNPSVQEQDKVPLKVVPGKGGSAHRVELGDSKSGKTRLTVSINLTPALELGDEQNWYAGSATSVRLDNKEILEAFKAELGWIGHDPEKRCMQVDHVSLLRAPWETMPYEQVNLFNKPYRLVSQSKGLVRASITIAADLLDDYSYTNPETQEQYSLKCELYRVISLYAGADYVIEELFVKGTPTEAETDTLSFNLPFIAHYFTYMCMGFEPKIYQYANLRDWFAVGSGWPPYPGYGFATDAHISPLRYPHRDFLPNDHNRFSWQLLPCKSAKCLHLFMRNQPKTFDSRTGHAWYELIYKPLKY